MRCSRIWRKHRSSVALYKVDRQCDSVDMLIKKQISDSVYLPLKHTSSLSLLICPDDPTSYGSLNEMVSVTLDWPEMTSPIHLSPLFLCCADVCRPHLYTLAYTRTVHIHQTPWVHTYTHSASVEEQTEGRHFPNGKAHCKKITVKPARALSNYFTVSAQMRRALFTLQWNLWPLMTDCISPPHCTLSLLKVTQQHINFS